MHTILATLNYSKEMLLFKFIYWICKFMICIPVVCSADEEQQRDVVRAAGPPQSVAEERGAGMPRRRRNLAAVMANRRQQREVVEQGKCCQMFLFQHDTVRDLSIF